MVLSFRYKDGFDTNPLVLVLYNDRKTKKIEGVNLNYVTVRRIEKLFDAIKQEGVPLEMDEIINKPNKTFKDFKNSFLNN